MMVRALDHIIVHFGTDAVRQDLLLETMWENASEAEFSTLWQAEVEEMSGKTRTNTPYLVTNILLPV
jgi:hypothetical protein